VVIRESCASNCFSEGSYQDFPGVKGLEFVNAKLGFDTRSAGLRCDEWRRSVPDPLKYRPWIKDAFATLTANAGGRYTPEAAHARSSIRSGQALVINFSMPCPAILNSDCKAIWLDWGECERIGNHKIMRYTIEAEEVGAGAPCEHLDGSQERHLC
jgi:hypothetical protein